MIRLFVKLITNIIMLFWDEQQLRRFCAFLERLPVTFATANHLLHHLQRQFVIALGLWWLVFSVLLTGIYRINFGVAVAGAYALSLNVLAIGYMSRVIRRKQT